MSVPTPLGIIMLVGAALVTSSEPKPQTSRLGTPKRVMPWDTRRKTGDQFHDDSFFNPWAPGGTFNKKGRE